MTSYAPASIRVVSTYVVHPDRLNFDRYDYRKLNRLYCVYCRDFKVLDQFSAAQKVEKGTKAVEAKERYCLECTPKKRAVSTPNLFPLPESWYKIADGLKVKFKGQDEWKKEQMERLSRRLPKHRQMPAASSSTEMIVYNDRTVDEGVAGEQST